MATNKKRVNITLSPELERAISRVALRDKVPQATKAAELLRLALEIEEDEVWDALASSRDARGARYVSHQKAWK